MPTSVEFFVMIVGELVIGDEVVVINWVVPTSKNEEISMRL